MFDFFKKRIPRVDASAGKDGFQQQALCFPNSRAAKAQCQQIRSV